jgi:hypothetical protein
VAEWRHCAADVTLWLADCTHFAADNSKWAYLEAKESELQALTEGTVQNLEHMLLNSNKVMQSIG